VRESLRGRRGEADDDGDAGDGGADDGGAKASAERLRAEGSIG
jgi:hypothetical protein